jgi:hypothetical protein
LSNANGHEAEEINNTYNIVVISWKLDELQRRQYCIC